AAIATPAAASVPPWFLCPSFFPDIAANATPIAVIVVFGNPPRPEGCQQPPVRAPDRGVVFIKRGHLLLGLQVPELQRVFLVDRIGGGQASVGVEGAEHRRVPGVAVQARHPGEAVGGRAGGPVPDRGLPGRLPVVEPPPLPVGTEAAGEGL